MHASVCLSVSECTKGEKEVQCQDAARGIPGNPADMGIPSEVRETHGTIRAAG